MAEQPHHASRENHHAENVERTLKELQKRVAEQEELLNQLRNAPFHPPKEEKEAVKASLEVMKTAYEDVAKSEPFLPFRESILPAVLALRNTHRITAESRAYMASQKESLEQTKRRLETEQANLNDQKALNKSLEARLQSLRDGQETSRQVTPKQAAKEKTRELRQKISDYNKDTSKLIAGLNKFINGHLGAMLAAEELGGPVVGGMLDVDSDILAAGFTAKGKPSKRTGKADQDKRQRRLDNIWGADEDRADVGTGAQDEATVAGKELRELTEKLLNSAMEAAGESSAAYVRLPRESAAARFLVRAKVAEFHPRDATRLKLVDFGREIDT
ncbi:Chromosome segregation protein smc [Pleurostoma richardsiae]|uniref:Chromosome segregation protein smc n=1 Tax=Pleurostoma richardsiae TaxID=41990 RepID=A0AA38RUD1_9PEZI|nr:Chromosome segregation protein smc [Pleurostoma richardsiae]